MKQNEIVFLNKQIIELRKHLLGNHRGFEELAYLLAGVNETTDRLQLLVKEIIPVPGGAFEKQGSAILVVKPEFSKGVYRRCYEEGLSLIEAHSHPFDCSAHVSFSHMDTQNELKKFTYIEKKIPDIINATIVFGQNSLDAHFWDKATNTTTSFNRIRIIGSPVVDWLIPSSIKSVNSTEGHKIPEDKLSRQLLAFGNEGQLAMAGCTVGIVGVGGIGSIVAEMVARLGFGKVILVDKDCVEVSNLPRMLGTTDQDVSKPKVKTIATHLQKIKCNSDMQILPIHASIQDPTALSELRNADFILGCVDNFGARLLLNQISMKYYIPYIDCGSSIEINATTKTVEAGGQVIVVIPGRFCLDCIGFIDQNQASQDLMDPEDRQRHMRLGYITDTPVPTPSVGYLNMTVASLALSELVNLVVGCKPVSEYLIFDAQKQQIKNISCESDSECVTCAPSQLLGRGDLEPWPDFFQQNKNQIIQNANFFM